MYRYLQKEHSFSFRLILQIRIIEKVQITEKK